MAIRTVKFFAKAYAESGNVSATVNFNNTQVHAGTVNTINTAVPESREEPLVELFSFEIDSSVTGSIPVSISVSGGTLFFGEFRMNYCVPPTTWDGTSRDADGYMIMVPTENAAVTFRDPNTNTADSDGKSNIQIDGAEPLEVRVSSAEDPAGDWQYRIDDGQVFTCDYYVDPDNIYIPA